MRTAEVLSSNVLHRSRIFEIVEQELQLPSGRTVVRRVVQHPGAVVMISQSADGRLILIAQYRFAVGKTLPGFPAGPSTRAKCRWIVPGANFSKTRHTEQNTGAPWRSYTPCQPTTMKSDTFLTRRPDHPSTGRAATAVKRVVCRWVAVMKRCEITGSRVEDGARVPRCPRRLMQVMTRLPG